MKVAVLLLLAGPALADEAMPYSKPDLERRHTVLREQQTAYEYAMSSLPACEALSYLRNAVANSEPAAETCPLTQTYFEQVMAWGRNLEDHCQEIERWAETKLEDPAFCAAWMEGTWGVADPIVAAVRDVRNPGHPRSQLDQMQREALGEFEFIAENSVIEGRHEFETFENTGQPVGELKIMRCDLGYTSARQYQLKALNSIFGHFTSRISEALDRSCRPNPPPQANLIDFIKLGRKLDPSGNPPAPY